MRKILAIMLCIVLFPLCLAACAEEVETPPDEASSLFPADYQPDGWIGYKQDGSAADEGYDPAVVLTTDGKFIFTFYSSESGTEQLSGTYRKEDNMYILTPAEGSDEKFYSEHSEEIRMTKERNTLVYAGATIGVTSEGDVFTEAINFDFY